MIHAEEYEEHAGEPRAESIYFAQIGEKGPIKIGYTAHPKARLACLETDNPEPLRILALIPGSYAEEQVIHEAFSGLRIRGEWYHPTAELVKFIEKLDSEWLELRLRASLALEFVKEKKAM